MKLFPHLHDLTKIHTPSGAEMVSKKKVGDEGGQTLGPLCINEGEKK